MPRLVTTLFTGQWADLSPAAQHRGGSYQNSVAGFMEFASDNSFNTPDISTAKRLSASASNADDPTQSFAFTSWWLRLANLRSAFYFDSVLKFSVMTSWVTFLWHKTQLLMRKSSLIVRLVA